MESSNHRFQHSTISDRFHTSIATIIPPHITSHSPTRHHALLPFFFSSFPYAIALFAQYILSDNALAFASSANRFSSSFFGFIASSSGLVYSTAIFAAAATAVTALVGLGAVGSDARGTILARGLTGAGAATSTFFMRGAFLVAVGGEGGQMLTATGSKSVPRRASSSSISAAREFSLSLPLMLVLLEEEAGEEREVAEVEGDEDEGEPVFFAFGRSPQRIPSHTAT
jgi:hypothetical protein